MFKKSTARLQSTIAEYGALALVIYLITFVLSMAGFLGGIALGLAPQGVAAGMGSLAAAYLATKVIQPLRIGVTIVLVPIVGQILHRRKRGIEASEAASAE